jgi:putative MFS transporter
VRCPRPATGSALRSSPRSTCCPYGWRALYAIGGVPLLFWPQFRRGISETARFKEHAATATSRGLVRDWLGPMVALARAHPGRTLAMAAVAGMLGIGEVSAFQFTGYYAQRAHGWSPATTR